MVRLPPKKTDKNSEAINNTNQTKIQQNNNNNTTCIEHSELIERTIDAQQNCFIMGPNEQSVPSFQRGSTELLPQEFKHDRCSPINNKKPKLSKAQLEQFCKRMITEKPVLDDEEFERRLKERHGFIIHRMPGDGNCLFHAIAEQVYGDANFHDIVRRDCINYIEQNRDYFAEFIAGNFNEYINRMRQDGTFGDHVEIQACAEIYNRPVEIYCNDENPLNLFQNSYATDTPPIRLSYHQRNHYNSVIDPNCPTAGVGLGFSDLKPGMADKMQVEEAIKKSEQADIEQQIVEHIKQETEQLEIEQVLIEGAKQISEVDDLAQIERALEEEVRRASVEDYLESLKTKK